MTLATLVMALISAMFLPTPSPAAPAAPAPSEDGRSPSWDPDTVVVRYRPDLSSRDVGKAAFSRGLRVLRTAGAIGDVLVSTKGRAPTDVVRQLERDPRVAKVELNHRRSVAVTPNDTLYGQYQPYLNSLGLPSAWDMSKGSASLKIAIVDTGVDADHPDLGPVLPGRDYVNDDLNADDDDGHGTMLAGIAAARTNNGTGVAGTAWSASILPVKVLDATGSGTDFDVAEGVIWAVDNGASVVNLSLGSPDDTSTLRDAVNYALSSNVVVVAAAGNSASTAPFYPAAYPGVLTVTATDQRGEIASFSNSGPWVGLSAPGVDITSTSPPTTFNPSGYRTGSGTSFATPIVSGIAALVRAQNPQWSQATVVERLRQTSRDAGPTGFDTQYGAGSVDAAAALGGPPLPALAPFGTFHALTPERVLDTRVSGFTKVGQGGDIVLDLTGAGSVPSTGVAAVVMNLTGTAGTLPSFLTAYPANEPRPLASNVNVRPNQDVSNLVTVKVGAGGKVRIYNNAGSAHVAVDVVGWYGNGFEPVTGSRFTGLAPSRILDTRNGTGQRGSVNKVGSASSIFVDVSATGIVPAGVSAVVMNVTATEGTQSSFLTVHPASEGRPLASNVNLVPNRDVPNLVTAKVGGDGNLVIYNNAGSVHVVADVVGWYGPPGDTTGSLFTPLTPARILDTRNGGPAAKVAQNGTIVMDVTGLGGVPASGATSVVTNVTATESTLPSFVTVYPDEPRPTASNLNTLPGQDVANLVVARLGAGGSARIYNNAGSVHVVADVVGFFSG